MIGSEDGRKLLEKRKYYREHPEEARKQMYEKMWEESKDISDYLHERMEHNSQENKQ